MFPKQHNGGVALNYHRYSVTLEEVTIFCLWLILLIELFKVGISPLRKCWKWEIVFHQEKKTFIIISSKKTWESERKWKLSYVNFLLLFIQTLRNIFVGKADFFSFFFLIKLSLFSPMDQTNRMSYIYYNEMEFDKVWSNVHTTQRKTK